MATRPFKAEVYFVNMRDFIDMKWGTPEPITLRDKELGMVRLRANGRYSMAVQEPQMFVAKIVGTQGIFTTNQIEDYLRGHHHQPPHRPDRRDDGQHL